MDKTKLTAMTVAGLKALAEKLYISLPAGAKKADIIEALTAGGSAAAEKSKKPAVAEAKAAAPKKPAAKKAAVTKEKAPAKRAPAKKPAEKPAPQRGWKMPAGAEEPLMAQTRVSESKYYTGPAQKPPLPHDYLSHEYGDDRIALMVRDPSVAYAYWEATPKRLEREKAWFGWDSKLCVRIYDITGVQFDGANAAAYFDQEVYDQAGNWYFELGRPNHSFCADIGLLSPSGRFLTLARSNYITMPRDGVSDVLDEEWMLLDEEFWKLYGFKGGLSSPEIQEMIRRRRLLEITSPGMFSREKAKRK